MKMIEEQESPGMAVLIQFYVGPESPKEMAIFVDDLEEARAFVHMSLRWAVKGTGRDNGAAELFPLNTKEKLGRMAVLFDESSPQGIDHEQWTWVEGGREKNPLHYPDLSYTLFFELSEAGFRLPRLTGGDRIPSTPPVSAPLFWKGKQ